MTHQYLFFNDYSEGAHPRILAALNEHNLQQELGYSEDSFSLLATQLIQQAVGKSNAGVHFVATGTQANIVCLASLLKPYESVIAVDTGHINVYEAGAIEATGHKVHSLPAVDGKLTAEAVQELIDASTFDQMVKPKVIYISHSTEIGSIYKKRELEKLSEVAKKNNLYLYIDGARLGHAIMAHDADLNLKEIAELSDIFYIGGTKNGGLMGEVIVIPHVALQENFRCHLRQRGALLAKARTVSIQFIEFFKDNLYWENAKHANEMAQQIAQHIQQLGYEFLTQPTGNQLFPILPKFLIEKLKTKYGFYDWSKADKPDHAIIRLVTSWSTPVSAVKQFMQDLS